MDQDITKTFDSLVQDLRRYAAGMLRRCQSGLTIQPTELVNMAFLKLNSSEHLASQEDPGQVFGLYITTMKNLLRDHLRKRGRVRHGGDRSKVALDIIGELEQANVDPFAFIEFLDELELIGEERKVQVVIARVVYKLTNEEIAAQMKVSVGTVESDMRQAREWLKERMLPEP